MAQNDPNQSLSAVSSRPGILVQDTTCPSITTFFYTSSADNDGKTDIREISIPEKTLLLTSCEGLMLLYRPIGSPYLLVANSELKAKWRCMLPAEPEVRYCAIGRTRDTRKYKLVILCMNCGAQSGWYVRTLGEDRDWRKLNFSIDVDFGYEYDLNVLSTGGVIYWTTSGSRFKVYAFDLSEEKFYIIVTPLNDFSPVSYSESGSRVLVGGFVTKGGFCTLIVPDKVTKKLLVYRLTDLCHSLWMRHDDIFLEKVYKEFVERRAKPVIWADHYLICQIDSRVVEQQIQSKLVMYLRATGTRKTLVNPLTDPIHKVVLHTPTSNWFVSHSQHWQGPDVAPSTSHFNVVTEETEGHMTEREEVEDEDMSGEEVADEDMQT